MNKETSPMHHTNNPDLVVKIEEVVCPKCGWKSQEGFGLNIDFNEDIDGDYCMRCWARDIAKRVPKMRKEQQ